ncbi:MAG TPA: permease-like cell division protein FtsX [Jatrophihabitantaceae bacterium]|jgi:cell division transport system permease protein|nr:permease-like cell division protein FtsX [Jatrophihabitantaceae bacterium]
MRANFVLSGVATGIRRNLTMTIALILSTAIALSFVGASLLANREISKFKNKYEDKINVSIYLCPTQYKTSPPCTHKTTDAEQAAIQSALASDPLVKSQRIITEEQAYELGRAQQPDVANFLKVGVFPASFSVKLRNLQTDYPQFAAKYAALPGVGQVKNQIDTINTLLNIIDSVRWFSIIVALIVLVASILLIANTIQVAAAQRRNETSIMRLVGASRWMTELPFMLEAVIAAAIGGLIAVFGIWFGKHYVLDNVFSGPTHRGVIPNLGINDVLVYGGISLLVGVVLSAITAFATLRFYVRL